MEIKKHSTDELKLIDWLLQRVNTKEEYNQLVSDRLSLMKGGVLRK